MCAAMECLLGGEGPVHRMVSMSALMIRLQIVLMWARCWPVVSTIPVTVMVRRLGMRSTRSAARCGVGG